MPVRDVISYNSMIAGLAMHGRSFKAVELYRKMFRIGLTPTARTFVGVVNACNPGGLVDHCGCIVNLFGRVGRLNEAYDFILSMRVEPDHIFWGALLGACRVHGNHALGEEITKLLMTSKEADSGTYILLANAYSSFGKREDAARTWLIMKERGIEKEPGCSLIEIDNEIHEFLLGDIKHPNRGEIYRMLEEMNDVLVQEGFSPTKSEVLHGTDDEKKQVL